MSYVKETYILRKRDLYPQETRSLVLLVCRYLAAFCLELLNLFHMCVKTNDVICKRDLCRLLHTWVSCRHTSLLHVIQVSFTYDIGLFYIWHRPMSSVANIGLLQTYVSVTLEIGLFYILWRRPYWYATLASAWGTEITIWSFLYLGLMLK